MVENRPFVTFLSHLVVILGLIIIAFPVWMTFVAATHDQEAALTMSDRFRRRQERARPRRHGPPRTRRSLPRRRPSMPTAAMSSRARSSVQLSAAGNQTLSRLTPGTAIYQTTARAQAARPPDVYHPRAGC